MAGETREERAQNLAGSPAACAKSPAPRMALSRAFRVTRLPLAAAALVAALSAAGGARATVVERVVAVVGERAILMSDLKQRALPFLVRIQQDVPPGAQRNAAISQTYKTVLERMVDEELQQRAANRSKIVVDAREVDDAIGRIASQAGLSVDQLVREAMKTGLDERAYRNELRRQILELKLMNLRVQGRIKVTEEDLRTAYRRLVMEERRKLAYRAAWIRLDLPSSDRTAGKAKRAEAESIAARIRSGEDFAALARQVSDDAPSRARGGDLGRLQPGTLSPAIEAALMALEPGQVGPVVKLGDSLFVLKLVERDETELPSFDEAKNELGERVYLEKMNKARRSWLDGLRRQTHVEVRL